MKYPCFRRRYHIPNTCLVLHSLSGDGPVFTDKTVKFFIFLFHSNCQKRISQKGKSCSFQFPVPTVVGCQDASFSLFFQCIKIFRAFYCDYIPYITAVQQRKAEHIHSRLARNGDDSRAILRASLLFFVIPARRIFFLPAVFVSAEPESRI